MEEWALSQAASSATRYGILASYIFSPSFNYLICGLEIIGHLFPRVIASIK